MLIMLSDEMAGCAATGAGSVLATTAAALRATDRSTRSGRKDVADTHRNSGSKYMYVEEIQRDRVFRVRRRGKFARNPSRGRVFPTASGLKIDDRAILITRAANTDVGVNHEVVVGLYVLLYVSAGLAFREL